MICPVCGRTDSKEWKHCCREKILVCSRCCRECEYANRSSTMGGLMCRWEDNRLSDEERKELNLIDKMIQRKKNAITAMKRLDGPIEDMEAQLDYLLKRKSKLKGEE